MKNLIPIAFLSLLFSCSGNKQESVVINNAPPLTEEQSAIKTVKDFYSWYALNHQTATGFDFVIKGDGSDSTQIYQLDQEKLSEYLSNLNSTALLTPKFSEREIKYYKTCESKWQEYREYDGVPWGLEFDRLLHAQEDIDSILYNISANKVTFSDFKKVNENESKVIMHGMAKRKTEINLVKVDGNWKIDCIDCDAPGMHIKDEELISQELRSSENTQN